MPEDGSYSSYQGDAALSALLRAAGSPCGVPEVRDVIAGVLGASDRLEVADWAPLVVPNPDPALVGQLGALADDLRARAASVVLPSPAARLARVREEMARLGIDGFLVPKSDEYQNEYVPASAERLAWLTGFTGSAGLAVVLPARAAIFVDGRYTLQVRAEVDHALYEFRHLIEEPADQWLAETLSSGMALGYDPWLHTPSQLERFAKAVGKVGARLVPVERNPVDLAWGTSRPAVPLGPVVAHSDTYGGRTSETKRTTIAAALVPDNVDALVVTAVDSLSWLFNIRGADVVHTPLPLGFAILHKDGTAELFMDRRKLTQGLVEHLGNSVAVQDLAELPRALAAFGGKRVQLDPGTTVSWFFDRLKEANATIVSATDPITLPKALKNETEIEGTRAAHRRDGVAMVRFLHWLDNEVVVRTVREIEASDRLEAFRREGDFFRDLSFPTISGAGPNGAIVHYRASPVTERVLGADSLYLVNSGAQYLDGTTDITRTVAIGKPSDEMRDRFTRVLKGHIAVAMAKFPKGTNGSQLDALARYSLWQIGVNYDHGTGHGVGSYLGVHEGPQRISAAANSQPLLPGMIVSNEPGYYKSGAYGIRIENLELVTKEAIDGAEREMFGFESLTLCPIDRRAIVPELMDPHEIAYLDDYHAHVRELLTPLLPSDAEKAWLAHATAPLAAG